MTISSNSVGLSGISVELGDRKRAVESIEGVADAFRNRKLPMNATLLSYGSFHESTEAPEEPISRAIAQTLARTGTRPADVERFVLATADAEFLADRDLLPRLLARHGFDAALPMSITSQECTGLLAAIDVARRYVRDGDTSRVIVVSQDRAKDDAQRIQAFGVVSDAAVAALVSNAEAADFRIDAYAHRADLRGMRGGDDFASRKALLTAVTAEVLAQRALPVAAIAKVFSTNFFKPLAAFNAATLGLAEHQLFAELTPEIGHCLSADPVLNLAEFVRRDTQGKRGDRYLLQAYAPGFLAAMLLERLTAPTVAEEKSAELMEQSW
ncbi:MAG TPA: hypothetical protein VFB32_07195 [Rudaea sp.]|nr:hypothetical protein [Rudaea sp.]